MAIVDSSILLEVGLQAMDVLEALQQGLDICLSSVNGASRVR